MRSIAKSVGIGVSGVYHHFPDKETLYLETVKKAFSNKAQAFTEIWRTDAPAEIKLTLFVERLVTLMLADYDFHCLMQRELLEGNPERMELLAEGVFKTQFSELMYVSKLLAPKTDPHQVAVSVISLVCHYIQMGPIRKYLPGYQVEHERPEVIAKHISGLLLNGLIRNEGDLNEGK